MRSGVSDERARKPREALWCVPGASLVRFLVRS